MSFENKTDVYFCFRTFLWYVKKVLPLRRSKNLFEVSKEVLK